MAGKKVERKVETEDGAYIITGDVDIKLTKRIIEMSEEYKYIQTIFKVLGVEKVEKEDYDGEGHIMTLFP